MIAARRGSEDKMRRSFLYETYVALVPAVWHRCSINDRIFGRQEEDVKGIVEEYREMAKKNGGGTMRLNSFDALYELHGLKSLLDLRSMNCKPMKQKAAPETFLFVAVPVAILHKVLKSLLHYVKKLLIRFR